MVSLKMSIVYNDTIVTSFLLSSTKQVPASYLMHISSHLLGYYQLHKSSKTPAPQQLGLVAKLQVSLSKFYFGHAIVGQIFHTPMHLLYYKYSNHL